MWRQGDVLIAQAQLIPTDAKPLPVPILARGEITGHSHRIAEPNAAQCWELNGQLYLKVIAESATVIHDEHQPITLPQGIYRVWLQREYSPEEIRRIVD
ncbi:MAG: hypothetical protein MUF87_00295 [Anaerolineae bacterium]|nr:hypothetical protein [Anaerolineae bacterium]